MSLYYITSCCHGYCGDTIYVQSFPFPNQVEHCDADSLLYYFCTHPSPLGVAAWPSCNIANAFLGLHYSLPIVARMHSVLHNTEGEHVLELDRKL